MKEKIKLSEMRYYSLSPKILAVAVRGEVNDWTAYIGVVKGLNHDLEYKRIAKYGEKLYKEIAEAIFPEYKILRWRD